MTSLSSIPDAPLRRVFAREKRYLMQTYARFPLLLTKGKGAYVWDHNGVRYLDCVAGVAVNNVGHCHPKVVAALTTQARTLIHTSNWYYTHPQLILAEKLSDITGFDRFFFCNSGAEAVEGAIKLARKYMGKPGIISTRGAFHGRTFGALSATWKEGYRKPYEPLVPDVIHVEYGNVDAVAEAITSKTAAVIVESIQGEAGVILPPLGYLSSLKRLCEAHNILLIVDEIQTGFGRTGRWFAYEHERIKPDIICVAKAIAGGLPMGAFAAREDVASAFGVGDHGSTFGGNPLVCAAACAVIDVIKEEKLVRASAEKGKRLMRTLSTLPQVKSGVWEVRGKGLMIAVDIREKKAREMSERILHNARILTLPTTEHNIRLVPPLVIDAATFPSIADALRTAAEGMESAPTQRRR